MQKKDLLKIMNEKAENLLALYKDIDLPFDDVSIEFVETKGETSAATNANLDTKQD